MTSKAASLLVILLALGLLSGCGTSHPSSTSPSSPSGTASAGKSTPTVGQCRELSVKQVAPATNQTTPIPCTQPHTARTFMVAQLPKTVPMKPNGAAFEHWLNGSCTVAFDKALGGTARDRSITTFSFAFFVPTRAQQAAGARWVRCDLIAQGSATSMTPLPAGNGPVFAHGVPDKYAVCLSGAQHVVTTCDRPHLFRELIGFAFPAGAKAAYPSPSHLQQVTTQRCKPLANGEKWFSLPPTRSAWAKGARSISCWADDQPAPGTPI